MTGMMDRFNALPHDILPDLLSFLRTKEAVQAQLISKRWKNMWAYVPVLEFDADDYVTEEIVNCAEHENCDCGNVEWHNNFVRVIDFVLASREIQQIDRFKLFWRYQAKIYDHNRHPVRRWILHVLERSPRMVSIYVQPIWSDVQVPDTAFSCSTLEEMKLQIDNYEPEVLEPELVNLPRLRKLNLGYFTIKADFMERLLHGCPNLEELELYACRLNLSQISCNNLKSLVINGSCNSTDIRVSIPSLQYLKVTVMSHQSAGMVFENMSSLDKACVCFLTADGFGRPACYSKASILKGLSGVTNLEIVLHGSEAEGMLKHALKDCPDFKNLKAVHFESFDVRLLDCVDMINRLVEHSTILEHLSFYGCKDGYDDMELLKKLKVMVSGHGPCRLVKCNQARIYDCLDKLMTELSHYMIRYEKMVAEVAAEEEDYDDNNGNDDDDHYYDGDDDDGEDYGDNNHDGDNDGGDNDGHGHSSDHYGGEAPWQEQERGEDEQGSAKEENDYRLWHRIEKRRKK